MASERWLSSKVELLSGPDIVLEPPAGRVMIVSPRHTLAELAEAIDLAFGRWDHSHLHEDEEYGAPANQPVPISGWIPDQYGRVTEDE